MALEGTIKEFGVTDILQLMAQQQKTGILVVEKKEESAEIYFSNGEIVATHSSRHADMMGEMLVKGRLITQEHLVQALEKQQDTFDLLGNILLKEGLIGKEQLEQIIMTQVYETFYDILQWREGTYRFVADSGRIDPSMVKIPGLESLLLDVLRMIDEWPDVRRIIRSFDMVFGKTADRSAEDLEEEELPVYSLVDGNNTVEDIIAGSLQGRFVVCKTLVELLQDEFIELVAEKAPKAKEKKTTFVEKNTAPASYAVLGVVLIGLLLLPSNIPTSLLPALSSTVFKGSYVYRYGTSVLVQRLEHAVEMYHLNTATYPESVSDLVSANMLGTSDLRSFTDHGISYSRTATYYTINIGS